MSDPGLHRDVWDSTLVYTDMCGTQVYTDVWDPGLNRHVWDPGIYRHVYTITVKALINAQAFIRIITYHRERGGRLLEASQLTF